MEHINLDNKRILVTGSSGFIGSFLVKRLCEEYPNTFVVGLDNMNDYYDVSLKEYRLSMLESYSNYHFIKGSIADKELINRLFKEYCFDIVVNLAAQAGVRYSIDHPDVYIESNVIGFYNILEVCRNYPVKHLVYASSSSVYGDNTKVPFSTSDKTDTPVSLYAATKKSDELFAYSYSKLYDIPTTGLRFFTVYGPAGRPDMAYFSFTNKLLNGEDIFLYNYGKCKRDFTYIDDVVEGIMQVLHSRSQNNPPYALYNIGNSKPENLLDFVNILRDELVSAGLLPKDYDLEAHTKLLPMQPGDVTDTYADVTEFVETFGFKPNTSLQDGLRMFVLWYKEYYKTKDMQRRLTK